MRGLGFVAVMGAVDLDDEAVGVGDEIEDVTAERGLAAEGMAFGAEGAEEGPELAFRRSGGPAQGAGAEDGFAGRHSGWVAWFAVELGACLVVGLACTPPDRPLAWAPHPGPPHEGEGEASWLAMGLVP